MTTGVPLSSLKGGGGRMGKVEALGLIVAAAGFLGAEATDPPVEANQLATAERIVGLSREEFASWCGDKDASSEVIFESSDERQAACAWIDRGTGAVWHTVLHFDAGSSTAYQADAGLLDGSADALLRLVYNEHGASDGRSLDGLPVWKVDVAGRDAFLAVAAYEEITLVRLKLDRESVALSTR